MLNRQIHHCALLRSFDGLSFRRFGDNSAEAFEIPVDYNGGKQHSLLRALRIPPPFQDHSIIKIIISSYCYAYLCKFCYLLCFCVSCIEKPCHGRLHSYNGIGMGAWRGTTSPKRFLSASGAKSQGKLFSFGMDRFLNNVTTLNLPAEIAID